MEDSLCTVLDHVSYIYIFDNKVFPTVFEVTNMTGPMILGQDLKQKQWDTFSSHKSSSHML